MNKDYSIDITMTPHPWDNEKEPYFWCVLENGCNRGHGWAKTPDDAWKDANEYYRKQEFNIGGNYGKNKE